MVFGIQDLKYWVLGPSACAIEQSPAGMGSKATEGLVAKRIEDYAQGLSKTGAVQVHRASEETMTQQFAEPRGSKYPIFKVSGPRYY